MGKDLGAPTTGAGLEECPVCLWRPFDHLMRWTVSRWPYWFMVWFPRPDRAIICRTCKSIVGWEYPPPAQSAPKPPAEGPNPQGEG